MRSAAYWMQVFWMSAISFCPLADCAVSAAQPKQDKVIRLPMPTRGPTSLDPAQARTIYDLQALSQVYEPLLQHKYLVRPLRLEPLLLAEMPRKSDDGRTYRFKLKKGVRFQDDVCFPGGEGREMVAADVIYSWKRLADARHSGNWWILNDTIAGLDDFREQQNQGDAFDYDAPVEGFKILNKYEFEVTLERPLQRFVWTLAMPQLSIVPREAVESYGARFAGHSVGTGPFLVRQDDWIGGERLTLRKNATYHASFNPKEHMAEKAGLDIPAGTRLPIVDRIEIQMYRDADTMWSDFQDRRLDYTHVPNEKIQGAFAQPGFKLREELKSDGITGQRIPLLDFIFYGFNMEDSLVGGYSDKQKALRQAISLAIDLNEINKTFYAGSLVLYDGPIPPGLDGHPKDGRAEVSYRGPDLERARKLLKKAGYPGGKNLPPIDYYTNRTGVNLKQVEIVSKQLERIGVKLNPHFVDFAALINAVNNKKAPMFGFAWGSDYADAENNLALFYGPNASPGSNHFNYHRDAYDRLYVRILGMEPSPERTRLYGQMRDMVIEDCPFVGSMARTRFYLSHSRLKNFKPSEDFHNWLKYLDVAE